MPTGTRQFFLRKLHSLTGLVPVGAFLLEHYYTNLKAVGPGGEQRFDEVVRDLQGNPLTIWAEIGLIGLPLLFHALYGVVISTQARPNNAEMPYLRNWMYTLQRITGAALLLFISYHVYNTRLMPYWNPGHPLVTYAYMRSYLGSAHLGLPVASLYIIGITAAAFHLANGLWNMGLHWGLTIGPRSQRLSGVLCSALGIALLATGLWALSAFTDPAAALALTT